MRSSRRFAQRWSGADVGLLAVVGGIGDTTSDEDVLQDLKLWNKAEPPT